MRVSLRFNIEPAVVRGVRPWTDALRSAKAENTITTQNLECGLYYNLVYAVYVQNMQMNIFTKLT
jgi:hypothetical protein